MLSGYPEVMWPEWPTWPVEAFRNCSSALAEPVIFVKRMRLQEIQCHDPIVYKGPLKLCNRFVTNAPCEFTAAQITSDVNISFKSIQVSLQLSEQHVAQHVEQDRFMRKLCWCLIRIQLWSTIHIHSRCFRRRCHRRTKLIEQGLNPMQMCIPWYTGLENNCIM